MALIECPNCGEKVSDVLPRCMYCGYSFEEEPEEKEEKKTAKDFKKMTADVALTPQEIDAAIKNGTLSPKVKSIVTKLNRDGKYVQRKKRRPEGSFGAKAGYIKSNSSKFDDSYLYDSFYITDFYLICCRGRFSSKSERSRFSGNYMTTFSMPDHLVVVPLKYVNSIKYVPEGADDAAGESGPGDAQNFSLVIDVEGCGTYVLKDAVKADSARYFSWK